MEVRQANRIADALEEMVFTGLFQEGQRLDEASLAKRFGVSRTPIREALQRLVTAGLAKQVPRRGVFVRQPNPLTLIEMFETMAEMEAVCGRLAAKRMDPDMLDDLKALSNACSNAVVAEDRAAYSEHNESFHHLIYRSTANSFLEGEALRLYGRLKPFRRVQFQTTERMAESNAEHEAIIAAIEQGDGDRAAAILREHVASQGSRFHPQMAKLRHDPYVQVAS